MKIKTFFVALLLMFVFCSGGFVKAQTEDNSALIAQLQAQILSLIEQLNELISQQSSNTSTNDSNWCHTFNANLGFVNSGSDEIWNLHAALSKEGFSSGTDNISTYAEDTAAEVVQFQAKYGIKQTGFVGPQTRAKLNALYGCVQNDILCPSAIQPLCAEGEKIVSGGVNENGCPLPGTCVPDTDSCTPNWTCGWGACANGYQSQVPVDSNNCGQLSSSANIACTALARQCATQQSITVTSPNGNESWKVGETHNITWNSANLPSNAYVSVGINGDGQTSTLSGAQIARVLASARSYSWTIPSAFGGEALAGKKFDVYVNWSEGSLSQGDTSDNSFSITASTSTGPSVKVTSPNGGETMTVGQTYNILWNSSNIPASISSARITLTDFTNGAQKKIADVSVSLGYYSWTASTVTAPGNRYKIGVEIIYNNSVIRDYSDNYFTIVAAPVACTQNWTCGEWSACTNSWQTRTCADSNKCGSTTNKPITAQSCTYVEPTFKITSPNGAESIQTGSVYNITWQGANLTTGSLYLADCTNYVNCIGTPSTKQLIASGISMESSYGSYAWNVPSGYGTIAVGSRYRIFAVAKQVNTGYPDRTDISDNNFSIVNTATTCTENWACESWSACVNSSQTRTCADSNYCGTTTSKPATTQSCTSSVVTPEINRVSGSIGTWRSGTTIQLSWYSKGVSRVEVMLKATDNVLHPELSAINITVPISRETQTNSAGADKMIYYTVPAYMDGINLVTNPGIRFKLVVKDIDSNLQASSDYFAITGLTTPPPPPPDDATVKILSPNGGEQFQAGQTYAITWQSSNTVVVSLGYMCVKGMYTYNGKIVSTYSAAAGSYSWTVPTNPSDLPIGSKCKIWIHEASDLNTWEESDYEFNIVSSSSTNYTPSIDLTSPVGGEIWKRGETHAITWNSNNTGFAFIYLSSTVNGVTKTTYVGQTNYSTTATSGSYQWKIPTDLAVGNYKMYIYDGSMNGTYSTSDSSGIFYIGS